jgi:hypothetical protein
MRKKIHTLIINDIPNVSEMNNKFDVSMKPLPFPIGAAAGRLAVCAPPNPIKRNIVVPIYSPISRQSCLNEMIPWPLILVSLPGPGALSQHLFSLKVFLCNALWRRCRYLNDEKWGRHLMEYK